VSELRLVDESDHKIEPIPDSFYTKLGRPASLFRSSDYPIEAVCLACSKPIVAESFLADWFDFERVAKPLHRCHHVKECRNRGVM
jgi:hypothetical protein